MAIFGDSFIERFDEGVVELLRRFVKQMEEDAPYFSAKRFDTVEALQELDQDLNLIFKI
jgi:hypothetical protein